MKLSWEGMKNLTGWIQVKSSADYLEGSPIFINPWHCYQLVWYQTVKLGFSLRWNPDPKENHWPVHLGSGSVLSCCNSTSQLQNWLFLLLLCQTWLPVRSLPARSPAGRLLWCDQINPRSPGTPALSRAAFPPSLLQLQPAPLLLTWPRGFPAFPHREGFTMGWSSDWGKVSWCAATVGFYFS